MQKDAKVRRIRMDNGDEYTGGEFEALCYEHGIIHETISPYMLENNAVAERYNRTLQEGALVQRLISITNY